ncbi:hypothetical protein B0H13DRAFT_1864350 [Mycena leptocephala]|nr:hypothetical protein B0H13DRAFT_1864350 [Mycena leptocephala]
MSQMDGSNDRENLKDCDRTMARFDSNITLRNDASKVFDGTQHSSNAPACTILVFNLVWYCQPISSPFAGFTKAMDEACARGETAAERLRGAKGGMNEDCGGARGDSAESGRGLGARRLWGISYWGCNAAPVMMNGPTSAVHTGRTEVTVHEAQASSVERLRWAGDEDNGAVGTAHRGGRDGARAVHAVGGVRRELQWTTDMAFPQRRGSGLETAAVGMQHAYGVQCAVLWCCRRSRRAAGAADSRMSYATLRGLAAAAAAAEDAK